MAGLSAAMLALAPAAAADDASFMRDLSSNSVSFSPTKVLGVGYGACQILRGGSVSSANATMTDAINYAYNAAYLRGDTTGIVTAAARQLCPDQLPLVRAYFDGN